VPRQPSSRCSQVLLSIRTIGYEGVLWLGGESVSQSPLKDKAFSTFLDQNPPLELRPENGISPSKACPVQWPVIDNVVRLGV
jgi:hypothetical protein